MVDASRNLTPPATLPASPSVELNRPRAAPSPPASLWLNEIYGFML